MILAVTGHRPEKLGGYEEWEGKTFPLLSDFCCDRLAGINPSLVITGLALGFDSAIASACIYLKLPYIAAVPFLGQDSRWKPSSRIMYRMFLEKAQDVEVVCEGGYAPWKMHKRNEWMVDRGDSLLALHDGSNFGGTFQCLEYARRRGKEVNNVWKLWSDVHAGKVQVSRPVRSEAGDGEQPGVYRRVVRRKSKGNEAPRRRSNRSVG